MVSRLNPPTLLQLRIELCDTHPVVWRCVLVPDTITLVQLHAVIQAAMGWWDAHLHEFDIGGLRYGMPDPEWDLGPELINEARKKLLTVLGNRKTFDYLYDFGDSWRHRCTISAIPGGIASPWKSGCRCANLNVMRCALPGRTPDLLRRWVAYPGITSSWRSSQIPAMKSTRTCSSGAGAPSTPGVSTSTPRTKV